MFRVLEVRVKWHRKQATLVLIVQSVEVGLVVVFDLVALARLLLQMMPLPVCLCWQESDHVCLGRGVVFCWSEGCERH